VLQRGGRDHEIGTIVAESGAQGAPTPRRSQVEWHHPLAIESQHPVEPGGQGVGKAGINRALSYDAALDFADADDAEEKVGGSLAFKPRDDHRVALASATISQLHGLDARWHPAGRRAVVPQFTAAVFAGCRLPLAVRR
jgi:hypothetical protein